MECEMLKKSKIIRRIIENGSSVFPAYGLTEEGKCKCGRENCIDVACHLKVYPYLAVNEMDQYRINDVFLRYSNCQIGFFMNPRIGVITPTIAENQLRVLMNVNFSLEQQPYQVRRLLLHLYNKVFISPSFPKLFIEEIFAGERNNLYD